MGLVCASMCLYEMGSMTNYNLKNIQILVIERNPLMLEAVALLLKGLGVCHVVTASTVDDGFAKFREQPLDLVISDWSPTTDALKFLEMVRNDSSKTNPFIPILVLTAYSDRDQLQTAVAAGINDFISKPFAARDIYKRIQKMIEIPNFYVRSGVYFGPCRRHLMLDEYHARFRGLTAYNGSERRLRAIHMADDSLAYHHLDT